MKTPFSCTVLFCIVFVGCAASETPGGDAQAQGGGVEDVGPFGGSTRYPDILQDAVATADASPSLDAVTDTGESEDTVSPTDTAPPEDAVLLPDAGITECASSEDCDDGIECTGDVCTIEGICTHDLENGLCFIDESCISAGQLNPDNECQLCDSVTSDSQWTSRQDAPCDDGDPCTEESFCDKGFCEGTPVVPCCGNAEVEAGELCDGDCPTWCISTDPCAPEALVGAGETCNAECVIFPVTQCTNADSCCPAGCGSMEDDDCESMCGDGFVDPGETCDGDCPVTCPIIAACTEVSLIGSNEDCSAECVATPVSDCINDDGCCPTGCQENGDTDCTGVCGNDVVDPGETCDGNCPVTCPVTAACTEVSLIGSNEDCSAECVATPVSDCINDDGCCPTGCQQNGDSDCAGACGNGVVDPGESCDGDCVTSCISSSSDCISYQLTGSPETCDSACVKGPSPGCISGDGCCPGGCNEGSDSDCDAAACEIEVEAQCVDSPFYSSIFEIRVLDSDFGPGGLVPPGDFYWTSNWPDQALMPPTSCSNGTGLVGVGLDTDVGCLHATYEIGNCPPNDYPKTCEVTLCYQCP